MISVGDKIISDSTDALSVNVPPCANMSFLKYQRPKINTRSAQENKRSTRGRSDK